MVWLTTAWKIEADRSSLVAPSLIRGWISVFAKYTAAGGDGIKGFVIFCIFIQTGGICLKKRCHLVNEGAGTSGTDAVHTLFHISAFKINDLGILAAQLDGNICLWSIMSARPSAYGNNFLYKRHIQILCQGQSAGTGDHRINIEWSQRINGFVQKSQQASPECWQNAVHNRKKEAFFPHPELQSSQSWNRCRFLKYIGFASYVFTGKSCDLLFSV